MTQNIVKVGKNEFVEKPLYPTRRPPSKHVGSCDKGHDFVLWSLRRTLPWKLCPEHFDPMAGDGSIPAAVLKAFQSK